jgi:hypothetical protein
MDVKSTFGGFPQVPFMFEHRLMSYFPELIRVHVKSIDDLHMQSKPYLALQNSKRVLQFIAYGSLIIKNLYID